jgi:enoyl-CoA hydratase/3-hydroxyacyl-CoA dehydrogenase
MSDLSGIDISIHVKNTINEAYGERCYNSTLLEYLAAEGRLGQKSGAGYYKYVNGKPVKDLQSIASFIEKARKDAKGLPQLNSLSAKDIVEIIFFPVVNEFLRIISEKHIEKKEDADVLSVFGYGYPAWRGGILFWAEKGAGGWAYVHKQLSSFSKNYGNTNASVHAFFAPCQYLTELAHATI